ncbi:hypothetical protein DLM78_09695 [Leptospira stimsonii]|uniref:Uncharacterized protein n=1 Tax=Leptospira stimsonii TaxID=2202203 RepID=A0A8B3CQT6_9LEPT|nr:hypothetical protein DLM78_09695 [Leptospira stimsonii]
MSSHKSGVFGGGLRFYALLFHSGKCEFPLFQCLGKVFLFKSERKKVGMNTKASIFHSFLSCAK